MRIRNNKRFLSIFAALFLFLVVSGCQKDASLNNQFNLDELGTNAFAVVDYYDVDANIQDATIETGLKIQVPPFIKTGEKIRVSTEDGSYLERAN